MKGFLTFAALTGGTTSLIALLVQWWWASAHGWRAVVTFNSAHEALFEGVLWHVLVVNSALVMFWTLKAGRR